MIDRNEVIQVDVGGGHKATIGLWDELHAISGLSFSEAFRILDVRTRRIAEVLEKRIYGLLCSKCGDEHKPRVHEICHWCGDDL